MAKRARLTTEEVIEDWDDIDLTDSEEWEGLDGVQEPVTLGSDDELVIWTRVPISLLD